jgi:hypothetical protein
MTKYRVTYTEYILREAVVEAADADQAIEAARAEFDDATHHHAFDVWQDNWQTEPYVRPPIVNRICPECGEFRS